MPKAPDSKPKKKREKHPGTSKVQELIHPAVLGQLQELREALS